MSCNIRWDSSETGSFLAWTKELLHDSLNSGKRPHILSSEINIENLSFGENSPEFEVLEIGDLAHDRFRGIFKLKYDGDGQIRLSTSIQANLLNIFQRNTQEQGGEFALPKFPLASQPFSIPLFVNLSQIRLSGIIVVVFSKSKGLTLVFKNDPLENIKVSSSFDNVQVIEKFLQNKIENQIRDLFRDILPSVLHKVSQKWTTSNILNQLHSKLHEENIDGSKVEKISIFEVNPSEPEISPANMLKLSTLTTSRLSFRLSVPPFPEVIDRPNLFKYESNFKVMGNNSKNIPIEIITNNASSKLDSTLNQITKIQSKLYHNEKNSSKLKRRTINMGSKKKSQDEDIEKQTASPSVTTDTTLIEESLQVEEERIKEPELVYQDNDTTEEEVSPLIPLAHIHSEPVKSTATTTSATASSSFSPLSSPIQPNLVELSAPNPMMFEKFQHSHPLLASPLSPLKSEMFQPFRSSSPRKSQSNLMTMSHVGIGGYFGNARNDSPPPPYI